MKFQLPLFAFALVLVFTTCVVAQHVKICEPKSVFMDDCNRCRCSDDGFDKSCTRIMCVKKPESEAGKTRRDYEGDLICTPGETFNISCHQCLCTEDGTKATAVCTLEFCPGELGLLSNRGSDDSTYCKPGTVFFNDCNTCICPASGLQDEAACTTMACVGQSAS